MFIIIMFDAFIDSAFWGPVLLYYFSRYLRVYVGSRTLQMPIRVTQRHIPTTPAGNGTCELFNNLNKHRDMNQLTTIGGYIWGSFQYNERLTMQIPWGLA